MSRQMSSPIWRMTLKPSLKLETNSLIFTSRENQATFNSQLLLTTLENATDAFPKNSALLQQSHLMNSLYENKFRSTKCFINSKSPFQKNKSSILKLGFRSLILSSRQKPREREFKNLNFEWKKQFQPLMDSNVSLSDPTRDLETKNPKLRKSQKMQMF